jgi:signal transduction histidine kinase
MRLLQVNLRGLLLYSFVLVLVSIPVSLFLVRAIINEEVDESIADQSDQFVHHIRTFEYLDDLETDLMVLDQLSSNIHVKPVSEVSPERIYSSVVIYDSAERKESPLRQLESFFEVKGKPYKLTVRMSMVDNDDLILTISIVQISLSILLATGLLVLNARLSRRIWKPFYKMLDHLKAYELDKNESFPIEKSRIVEFDDLNLAVNQLTERNRKVFLQQKEFIEDASHELQTPIAVFQGKLDMLMQSPTLSQSDAETILELESTAQRMSRLNKNLLLLSKIDNEQFAVSAVLDVEEIIENQLKSLYAMAEIDGIRIVTSLEPLAIHADRTLIEVLLTNIFHNAIRYSPKDEDITITLQGSTLSVSNKGQESRLTIDQMTQRFRKESSHPNSIGLGLAIVRKICDTYRYSLGYSFKNGTHTFTVEFRGHSAAPGTP